MLIIFLPTKSEISFVSEGRFDEQVVIKGEEVLAHGVPPLSIQQLQVELVAANRSEKRKSRIMLGFTVNYCRKRGGGCILMRRGGHGKEHKTNKSTYDNSV